MAVRRNTRHAANPRLLLPASEGESPRLRLTPLSSARGLLCSHGAGLSLIRNAVSVCLLFPLPSVEAPTLFGEVLPEPGVQRRSALSDISSTARWVTKQRG